MIYRAYKNRGHYDEKESKTGASKSASPQNPSQENSLAADGSEVYGAVVYDFLKKWAV